MGRTVAIRRSQNPHVGLLGEPATAAELQAHALTDRPKTRGDCAGGERPCPWAGCVHHLFLDVNPATGSIKFNHPGRETEDLEHSCALDLADQGVQTLDLVGQALGLTRERVRQIEERGARHLRDAAVAAGLDKAIDGPLGAFHGKGREVPPDESDDPRAEYLRAYTARKRREAEANHGG